MIRSYTLSDKRPDETNDEFVDRAVAEIPPEALLRHILGALVEREGFDSAVWRVRDLTAHGKGVSAAIVRRFAEAPR